MSLHFSQEEYTHRQQRLSEAMAAHKLDAMLLFAQESMYWLTGYDTFGFCFFQCLVVKAAGEMVLLTRAPDVRQAQHTSIIQDIRIWMDRQDSRPIDQLRDILDEMDLIGAKIGVEYDTHGLTGFYAHQLDERLKTFANLSDASGLVPSLRMIKSFAEMSMIREASVLADQAFEAGLGVMKPGVNESEILAAMQSAVLASGGDYPANEFIIGSGRDALLCRSKTGRRVLQSQDQITLEWAGVAKRYHSVLMRTCIIGSPTYRQKELFDVAHSALKACEDKLKPGCRFGDVFEAHASTIDSAGLHACRMCACGYSLGAKFAPSWMDQPMFYRNNTEEIVPNMCLFVHIILMDSDTETAMTLGRTYLTTKGEAEPLSKLPIQLVTIEN